MGSDNQVSLEGEKETLEFSNDVTTNHIEERASAGSGFIVMCGRNVA